MTIKIIEECRVSPQPTSAAVVEFSLPLTYFDMIWLNFRGIERVLFYKIPDHSNNNEEIIPKLKRSLSIALGHYLPLTGNLIYPLEEDSGSSNSMPILQYVTGDSVPLTVAEESEDDFNLLIGNLPRKCDKFYPLIPKLPPSYVTTSSKIVVPLFAVQITIFPNYSGVSIGWTNHHAAGDGNTIVRFIRAWASISKFDYSNLLSNRNDDLLPFYDRCVIKDPHNLKKKWFDWIMKSGSMPSSVIIPTTNNVRATFTLHKSEIQKLKNYYLLKKRQDQIHQHVSSYTVTCAYIWTCLLKTKDSTVIVGEADSLSDENKEAEFFIFVIDCRSRLDPPIPEAYFGNCVAGTYATATHEELVSIDGFVVASEIFGAAIQKAVNDKKALLSAYTSFNMLSAINWRRCLSVAGSPKYNTYDADFGWGRPEKHECISIDGDYAMSLSAAGEEEGGLEIGLSMPENEMEAFATIFTSGLTNF